MIMAGGTGGHVFPALAVADALRAAGWRVVWLGNPQGMDFLLRDCANICGWFRARGLEVDEQELFGELMAHAF